MKYNLPSDGGSEKIKSFQISTVQDENYRAEGDSISEPFNHKHDYRYDSNGNLIYIYTAREKIDGSQAEKSTERKLLWDEENRLFGVSDDGYVNAYWYDAAGERTVKESGDNEFIFVNGTFSGGNTQTTKFTAYVNPYLVVTPGGNYTKHIYIGSQRIVSKLGDLGSYGADPRSIPKAGDDLPGSVLDYPNKYAVLQQSIEERYEGLGVKYSGKDNGGQPWQPAGSNAAPELFQYFYHSDHLGSTSLISDLDGNVAQHIEYVPFGEVFIEERNNTWNTPFLFNAKELDEETGLYYYGARYYEPRASLWLSTDPLQEKYPGVSTYAYCHNNPVKLIDLDGLYDISSIDKNKKYGAIAVYQSNYSDIDKKTGIML